VVRPHDVYDYTLCLSICKPTFSSSQNIFSLKRTGPILTPWTRKVNDFFSPTKSGGYGLHGFWTRPLLKYVSNLRHFSPNDFKRLQCLILIQRPQIAQVQRSRSTPTLPLQNFFPCNLMDLRASSIIPGSYNVSNVSYLKLSIISRGYKTQVIRVWTWTRYVSNLRHCKLLILLGEKCRKNRQRPQMVHNRRSQRPPT